MTTPDHNRTFAMLCTFAAVLGTLFAFNVLGFDGLDSFVFGWVAVVALVLGGMALAGRLGR